MKSGYNYTIAHDYEVKIYIPYLDITFNGKKEAFLVFSVLISVATSLVMLVLYFKLELFFIILSIIIAFGVAGGLFYGLHFKNGDTGNTEFWHFYYKHIKKYTLIITQDGEERFVCKPYKERRIYVTSR